MKSGMDTSIIMTECFLRQSIIPLQHQQVLSALILAVHGWNNGSTVLVLVRKYTTNLKR
nr:hypothetical protein Iba_chr05aCG1730 [Ipomoea batatas]GMC98936.1 hypothetical protein Iba_chr05eCG0920 [Ipomoea batatas]GME05815.1 hypothetical protein Iba_scaffold3421CG0060 [Ipomoea batatas]GME10556.1 hypothetical protein Iba_scaffold10236CG0010 [Ipomoea batatas]